MEYYPWNKTLNYNAPITFVIGARGVGKTYGLRKILWKRWKKTGAAWVEVSRFADEIRDVMSGYLEKLNEAEPQLFVGYHVKYMRNCVYAAEYNGKDLPKQEDYKIVVYGVALSERQKIKKKTFAHVESVIFDEVILEIDDRYHHYLSNEYESFASVIDTVTRQNVVTMENEKKKDPHVYMLSNACDFVNPYMEQLGINRVPEPGYTWFNHKLILLHYYSDVEYSEAKETSTLAGRMLAGSAAGATSNYNVFGGLDTEFVEEKTKNAKYVYAVTCHKRTYSVWYDDSRYQYYITKKIPNNAQNVYALTSTDNTVDFRMLEARSPALQSLLNLYRQSCVFFETVAIKTHFLEDMAGFGLK